MWCIKNHPLPPVCFVSLTVLLVLVLGLLTTCKPLPFVQHVVKIGLVAPFEGPYRYVGYDAINAARLALQEVNTIGGIAGYNIELVAYDDQGTVAGAREAARNLIYDSDVIAVIGHYRDDTTQSVLELYRQAGLPLLVAGTIEGTAFGQAPWLCPLLDSLKETKEPGMSAKSLKIRWVGTVETLPPCAANDEIVGSGLSFASGTGSDSVVDIKDLEMDTDVVLVTLDPISSGELVKTLRGDGWKGLIIGGPALGSDLFASIAGKASIDVVFASAYRWPQLDGQDASFGEAYQSLGPHVPSPGPFALTTYRAVGEVLEMLEQVAAQDQVPQRHAIAPLISVRPPESVYFYRWMPGGRRKKITSP